MAGTTTSKSNCLSIDIRKAIQLHALSHSQPDQIESILDEDDFHSCQFQERGYSEQRRQLFLYISIGTSQLLNAIFLMVVALKKAPEVTRNKFIGLVKDVDNDGDTQLIILLWNIEGHWNELLGQIAGCIYLQNCKQLLNRANFSGQTALTVAVQADQVYSDLVRVLVLLGADPDICDKSNNNARNYVQQKYRYPRPIDQ